MTTPRFNRLYTLMQAAGLDALALNPGPSLVYLTGLHFHLSERPTLLLVGPEHIPEIILPELEVGKLADLPFRLVTFAYGDNPATWARVFQDAMRAMNLDGKRVGLEPTWMRYLEMQYLQSSPHPPVFVSAEETLAQLRLCKEPPEVENMRQAVRIAQQAFTATLPAFRVGVTEREAAAELMIQLLRAGCDSATPFEPIVAGGPNSADPHAVPTDRKFISGDLVVVDWGAFYKGYCSDLTRTLAIGDLDSEYERIAKIVAEANLAGRAAVRPGVLTGDVDHAGREVISKAGYGGNFIHRIGHGLGMEVHEAPYLFAGSTTRMAEGMAHSIEPGIYLSGRGGVRIEDDVVVTKDGSETLSDLPRELYRL